MSQAGVARPRWRDALVLAVLAAVILGGLVYYGDGLGGGDDEPRASAAQEPTPSASPSAQETAELESGPSSEPPETPAPGSTCWDGRATTSLKLCGLPEGARGLAWVFPSFAKNKPLCHRAEADGDNYPVVESYACFQQAMGRAVTVVYDRIEDPTRVENWMLARVGRAHMHRVPGPLGGRTVFTDGGSRPARITGTYHRFPYAVSVYAETPQAAKSAWKRLVRFRPEGELRGVRNG